MRRVMVWRGLALLAALGAAVPAGLRAQPAPAPGGPALPGSLPGPLVVPLARWLHDVHPRSLPGSDEAVTLTQEGDHYRLRQPLGPEVTPPGAAITATVRVLDATHLAVTDLAWPQDFTSGHTHAVLGQQVAGGTLDIAGDQASRLDSTIAPFRDELAESGFGIASTNGKIHFETIVTPGGTQYLWATEDGDIRGTVPGTAVADMRMAATRQTRSDSAALLDRLRPLRQALDRPGTPLPQDAAAEQVSHHSLLTILRLAARLLSHDRYTEHGEAVRVTLMADEPNAQPELAAAVSTYDLQQEVTPSGPSGLVLNLGVSVDGLTVTEASPGLASLLPRHIELRQHLTGLDAPGLAKAVEDANRTGGYPDLAVLAGPEGLGFDLDTIVVETASLRLDGHGAFHVAGDGAVTGGAELHATGLDASIAALQSDPGLARYAAGVILLKGLAQMEGDRATWQVTVGQGKLLVNGLDVAAMAAAMRPGTPP